jgi:hypothetical protein
MPASSALDFAIDHLDSSFGGDMQPLDSLDTGGDLLG